ncbi:MAG TPA: acetylxylan esterase [Bryobacteraceae bacterium]|jgi:cephalosporin-C deacetylase|nr:acetylxylan esterase [Bryobacteraceae bacterium]
MMQIPDVLGPRGLGIAMALFALALPLPAEDPAGFWKATLARLAAEPLDSTVEDTREPLPYKKFRVEYRSLDGVRVRAFLALPVRGGESPRPLRAVVTIPGYGGLQQGVMLDECQRGYAILQVYPRSQGPSADLWKIDGPDKLTWRLSRPDGAYYQGAYADVIRGVDYLVNRPDIDRDRIAIAGTSQGGGIALAVASLDPRLKAVVALLPFLCDMRRGARIEGSLVKKLLDQAGVNDERRLRTLDYFDPLQLVPILRAPALVSSGGRDAVCPAETIRAVFDRIPGVKSLFHDPELTHTSSETSYGLTWQWLDRWIPPR